MKNSQISHLSLAIGAASATGLFLLTSMQGTGESFIHGDVREFLSHISMVDLPDGQGGLNRTVRITGINVQVVNGLDATNGYPADPDSTNPLETQTNGLGNLIVGYNELGNANGDDRTGSHNLAFGHGNTFMSFGGIVGPYDCQTSGPYASVTGGCRNSASRQFASVSGGLSNMANRRFASVSGGYNNTATDFATSVSGGQSNFASGGYPLFGVAGGSVSGGRDNTASGYNSSVSGGNNRTASGEDDWVAGSLFEDN